MNNNWVMFNRQSQANALQLTYKIVDMLQEQYEIKIEELANNLNIKMIDLPWGVNSPFAYIFKTDGYTWCCLKPQYRKRD